MSPLGQFAGLILFIVQALSLSMKFKRGRPISWINFYILAVGLAGYIVLITN